MKPHHLLIIAATLVISGGMPLFAQNITAWTSADGKTIQAEFGSLSGETLTLNMNGKPVALPLSRLSAASQEQARKLAGGGGAGVPAAKPSAVVTMPDDPTLPAEGAWKTGLKTNPPKEGEDRIFLVNRGWLTGKLIGLDESSVTFDRSGKQQTFPRTEVSLLQLTDWMNPAKRMDQQEFKLRIVCEGEAERTVLCFGKGVIIRKVDAAPAFAEGGVDADDKPGSDRTSIFFEKGNQDRSVTTLTADVTLLVPGAGPLECDVDCARANGFAGPLNIRFLDPASGAELVSLKNPVSHMNVWFQVPLEKLRPGGKPNKVDWIGPTREAVKRMPALPSPPAPANPTETSYARVIALGEQALICRVLGLDAESLRVINVATGKPLLLPRWQVVTIELNDWESAWRNPKAAKIAAPSFSPPLTISFAGICAETQIVLQGADTIGRLVAPPHYLIGGDRSDVGEADNERTLGCHNLGMDQTPTLVEATVVLSIKEEKGTTLEVHHHYTNGYGGDLEMTIRNALTQKSVAGFRSKPTELQAPLKIQRSKLFAP